MAVHPNDLAVCHCYVTPAGQVRHIMEIDGDDVIYEARGKRNKPKPWGPKTRVGKKKFADAVEREVPCDYDPDVG